GTGYRYWSTPSDPSWTARAVQLARNSATMVAYFNADYVTYQAGITMYGYVAVGVPALSAVVGDYWRTPCNFGVRAQNSPSSVTFTAFESVNTNEQTAEQFDPAGFRTRFRVTASGAEVR